MNLIEQEEKEERVKKVKGVISQYLKEGQLYDKLEEQMKEKELDVGGLNPQMLLEMLEGTDLVDDLAQDLQTLQEIENIKLQEVLENSQVKFDEHEEQKTPVEKQIIMTILTGKKFAEFDKPIVEGEQQAVQNTNEKLIIFVNFLQYRFQTKPLPLSSSFVFNDERFVLDLKPEDLRSQIDVQTLKKLRHKIDMMAVIVNEKDQSRTVYGLKQVEWRYILAYQSVNLSVELGSFCNDSKIVGYIQIHLELFPKCGNSILLNEKLLTEQLKKELEFREEDKLAFYDYSKLWWQTLKQQFPRFSKRFIKIYAENEHGTLIPVPTFVIPLFNVQGIDTPFHALRFVNIIPVKKFELILGERKEIWNRFSTTMIKKSGDIEDHCTLLCSLLLGFGYNSYVVLGSNLVGFHAWVLTIEKSLKDIVQYYYWDCVTGQKLLQTDKKVPELFKKVGCVFNHQNLFANIQDNDYAGEIELNLKDPNSWMSMDEEKIATLVPHNQPQLILAPPSLNVNRIEIFIEKTMKNYVSDYRMIHGLITKYDEALSSIMKIPIANFEQELITGQTFGVGDFKKILKSYLPTNSGFKTCSMQFTHMNTRQMLVALKNSPECVDVMLCKGDRINFALKVKMIVYPENFYVIWLSLSVRYKQEE